LGRTIEAVWEGVYGLGTPRALRRPCRYASYVPDRMREIELSLPPDVAADVSDAEREIQRLNTSGPRLANLEALARLLLRAEAVASSRIERLEVSTRRLTRVQAARASGIPLADATADAVLGNIEAMAVAVEDVGGRTSFTLDDLLEIHRAVMRHTDRPEIGGVVRDSQNWIGGNDFNPCGAEYVPPPAEHVPALLDDLVEFSNTDDYPPLVQAALAHAQFETIHPFADGNGRAGRALIHVVLRRRGLAPRYVPPISLILATRSGEYIRGLTAYRHVGSPGDAEAQRGMS
jgi:Fic family protein